MVFQTGSVSVPYTLPPQGLSRADVSRVGAKAANLGELARAGFPVPDGYAVTTQAFDRFVTFNGLVAAQTPEELLAAEMPFEVEDALRSVSSNFPDTLLAMRSSGVAEDLEGASFAGQYETILGVSGHEALVMLFDNVGPRRSAPASRPANTAKWTRARPAWPCWCSISSPRMPLAWPSAPTV